MTRPVPKQKQGVGGTQKWESEGKEVTQVRSAINVRTKDDIDDIGLTPKSETCHATSPAHANYVQLQKRVQILHRACSHYDYVKQRNKDCRSKSSEHDDGGWASAAEMMDV